jgi:hypothetical protein
VAVLLVWTQPLAGPQVSLVQTLPSLQFNGVPGLQVPPPQTSCPLHTVLSSHGTVLFVCWHAATGSQASVVQTLPSLQFNGVPVLQVPPPQTSRPLHTVPSSHGRLLARNVQPLWGLQPSSVHGL